ncbi:MAG: transporter substrate-binding domain-containing protein [Methanospirillum sp.]|nr:transporter substrate-binding domain-containing protein [Methanospirillum sp.]
MMKHLTGVLFITCLFFIPVFGTAAEMPPGMYFITEEYPPLNYVQDNIPAGLSTDLLIEALGRMNIELSPDNITVMAWSDGYQKTRSQNNTAIFSTARTPERENLFSWVGPLVEDPMVFYATNRSLETRRPDNGNIRVVAIKDDIGEIAARDAGVSADHIFIVLTPSEAISRLVDGTSDVWVYAQHPGEKLIQTLAENVSSFYVLDELARSRYYIAFNNQTEPTFVRALQDELDRMKTGRDDDGISPYERIIAKYISPACTEKSQTRETITRLVNLTADALERDAPGTIADIQSSLHPYKDRIDPGQYVFIYDTDTRIVADAGNPSLAGTSFAGKGDVSGKKYSDEIVSGALANGTGIITYIFSNPAQSGLYNKETVYSLVNGSDNRQYIVCAGRYPGCNEM